MHLGKVLYFTMTDLLRFNFPNLGLDISLPLLLLQMKLTLISLIVQILKLTHHVKEYQIGKLLPGKLIYISDKKKKQKKEIKRGLRFSFSTKHQAQVENIPELH
jgi:hypothetical protein